jgi:hypothetical protein
MKYYLITISSLIVLVAGFKYLYLGPKAVQSELKSSLYVENSKVYFLERNINHIKDFEKYLLPFNSGTELNIYISKKACADCLNKLLDIIARKGADINTTIFTSSSIINSHIESYNDIFEDKFKIKNHMDSVSINIDDVMLYNQDKKMILGVNAGEEKIFNNYSRG